MASVKKPANKSKIKTTTKRTGQNQRKIAKPNYKSFRLHKKIKHESAPLPKARHILLSAIGHIKKNKKLFAGIIGIQFVLTLLLVTGFNPITSELGDTKVLIQELLGTESTIYTGAALLGVLASSSMTGNSEVANLYGVILVLIIGLALIWSLRQTHAGSKPVIKDAFYKGMYPLIPYILVFLVVLLQLLPMVIGNAIYSIVISNGIAVTGLEQTIWLLLFIGLSLLSFYMISSSLFALYIVTLPDVTPLQALRSARQLVLHRRLMIARKLLFLPVVVLVVVALLMLPIIVYLTPAAELIFLLLGNAMLLLSHAYVYELYRKML